jgi:transposase
MLLSEGRLSDHKGARLVLDALPSAKGLIADRGYDGTRFRDALAAKGITPCSPSSRSRKRPYPQWHDPLPQRHKVENLFAKLKDWRRIATCYDRCAHTFFSAICIAATVIFWLRSMSPEPNSNQIVDGYFVGHFRRTWWLEWENRRIHVVYYAQHAPIGGDAWISRILPVIYALQLLSCE